MTEVSTLDAAPKDPAQRGGPGAVLARLAGRVGDFTWVWFGLVGVYLLSALVAPGTLRMDSLLAIAPFTAVLAITGVGQTLVIQQRGLDLSVPGTITLAAVIMTKVASDQDSTLRGVVAGLVAAAIVGAINGLLVTRLSITPLVATLAMNAILGGAAYAISGGAYTTAKADWTDVVRARHLGIPMAALLAVAVVVVLAFVLRKTVFGRQFLVVGANPSTARAAGIPYEGHQLAAYVTCALCAGLGGVLLVGVTGAATPYLGTEYLLTSITAVVIGGTSLSGGRGSVVATAAGAILLVQLGQLTLSLGAPESTQLFVTAGALVLAVSLRHLRPGSLRRASAHPPMSSADLGARQPTGS
jgi:ribose transport system permease protein